MSPSSILDFTQRLYNDLDLANKYEWNTIRRGGATNPNKAKLHDKKYECMNSSETFEKKDCLGEKHVNLESLTSTDFFEFLIANWITVSN